MDYKLIKENFERSMKEQEVIEEGAEEFLSSFGRNLDATFAELGKMYMGATDAQRRLFLKATGIQKMIDDAYEKGYQAGVAKTREDLQVSPMNEVLMGGPLMQKMMAKIDNFIQSNDLNKVDNIILLLKSLSRETQDQIIKALNALDGYQEPVCPNESIRERAPTRVATDYTSVRNLGRDSSTGADTGLTWKDCYNKGLVLKTGPDGKGYCGEEGEDQLGETLKAMVEKLKGLGREAREKIIKGLGGGCR